jgi:Retrotransposon gag protein
VYNQKLEGEENKVRAIGSYLRELAWDWFEPILNEANNTPRTEWEARTRRIMGNYREFKKSLGKVFGQIDERKTAAGKLARLKQTTSVTLYITEFQTIASNLDWDDEALEDKFLEGLKQEVRQALIYYPNEAKDLDDLFERTQRIDRELKKNREATHFQRRPFAGTGRSFYGKGSVVKKDGEGDVIMKGAKVDIEKAKKERLCFHCGKPGHQAKFCRARKREAGKDLPFAC